MVFDLDCFKKKKIFINYYNYYNSNILVVIVVM